jgi:replication factor A1
MEIEETIKQIQSRLPELSREEILTKLEDKKRKTNSLISDEILMRMIASEFGVETKNNQTPTLMLSLRDLVPGLNAISVIGRVVAVFSPKTFEGTRSGKFASLFIADKTGLLRVILWNDKTELIKSGRLKVGDVIRVSHGYTREDHSGKVELHVGEKAEVEVAPKNVDADDYPTISRFAIRIRDITEAYKNKRVNITGEVKQLFPASSFERRDASQGKVMRIMLSDETGGEISVVVWNEKVDEIEQAAQKGVELQIVNAKVKKAMGAGLEIHVDAGTYLGMLPPRERFFKIADLHEGFAKVNVEGEVATKPMLRDVRTFRQETIKVASFELKDETGRIWVSAWRNQADSAKNLKIGEKVIIRNVHVKKGFSNQLELSTRNTSSIGVHNTN